MQNPFESSVMTKGLRDAIVNFLEAFDGDNSSREARSCGKILFSTVRGFITMLDL